MEEPKTAAPVQATTGAKEPKDKMIAILLAVFLGLFTWVYTYKVDAKIFWINLILSVVTLGLWSVVAYFWALILSITRTDEFYANFPNG